MLLMVPTVGNNVINMEGLVLNIVALLGTAVRARDIMLMEIVHWKWKKRSEIQFMLTERIIFVLLENQKRHAPIGILNIIRIVLVMILGARYLRRTDLTNVRIYAYRISQIVNILLLTRQSSKCNIFETKWVSLGILGRFSSWFVPNSLSRTSIRV